MCPVEHLVHILFNNLLDTRVTTSIHGLRPLGHPSDVQIVPDDLVAGMTYFFILDFHVHLQITII